MGSFFRLHINLFFWGMGGGGHCSLLGTSMTWWWTSYTSGKLWLITWVLSVLKNYIPKPRTLFFMTWNEFVLLCNERFCSLSLTYLLCIYYLLLKSASTFSRPPKQGPFSVNDMMGFITLEKNGKALDLFAREVSTDRITAIEVSSKLICSLSVWFIILNLQ